MDQYETVLGLIRDKTIFGDMLEGYFKHWEGAYDILPWDSGKYLFRPRKSFTPFCEALRSTPIGEKLCLDCDIHFARKAYKAGRPIHYICHAGLVDIAAPIVAGSGCIATMFCGQRLPAMRSEWKAYALADVGTAERVIDEYSAKVGRDLLPLWYQAETISMDRVLEVEERLGALARYLGEDWSTHLEAQKYQKEEEHRLRECPYS